MNPPPPPQRRSAWNLHLGRFLGIDVYLHGTFLILLVFIGFTHWTISHNALAVLEGVGFIVTLFFCVVLHEYGHALMARHYGITTRDITLYPIGGIARLERMPRHPWHELWVALAGPAVNVVIALLIAAGLTLTSSWHSLEEIGATQGPFLERILATNIFLAVFNLLPAFPMDGGRVLRAILAMRLDPVEATRIAARVGQVVALGFGFAGLFLPQPMLVVIAFFVWFGAAGEASMVETESRLSGVTVARAMLREYHALGIGDTVTSAVRLVLDGSQHDFPVVQGGSPVGLLTRTRMLEALSQGAADAAVESVMSRDFFTAGPGDLLLAVLPEMAAGRHSLVPVVEGGRLVGLLTSENVNEFLMISNALEAGKRA